ncbi:TfdA family taurine catabolism dioxygenase TauD [Lasiosphaeria hispida]|uniref:TfdA family taurine catabolism dioxygenase TauD n=1 Tax=Lasiosphaeria hispida TaxID=260671 RepID=A0AAJ0MBM8_9PEZI|nr:TfdA family taurine catabolism dioxygenase TauD [Lasiosphaeria hispida]
MPQPPRISLATAGLLRACLAPTAPSTLGRYPFSHSARTAFRSHTLTRALRSENTRPQASSNGAKIPGITMHEHPNTNEGALTLEFDDGGHLDLSLLWLRDSCPCAHCVDPDSGQKNFSTTALPNHPKAQSANVLRDGSLQVVWAPDSAGPKGPHTAVFPAADIEAWRHDVGTRTPHLLPGERTPWDKATYAALLESGRCRITYQDWLHDEDAFWAAFADLCETGMIFVSGVPEGEAEVATIAQRIGILQHTFYGFTWDVRSKPHAENVAYTSQFLGLHQDLMYHNPIPRLQLLHCLANSCEGGESIFSDGLRAALEVRLTRQHLYRRLKSHPIHFHYKKGGHSYERKKPVIAEYPDGLIARLHWSPPFQAPFRRESMAKTESGAFTAPNDKASLAKWKEAATVFQASLEAPDNVFEVKLKPGECVIFDNTRLQHGRREFVTGLGHRWLKGTYISDQVFRAVQDRLQGRRGVLTPDLPTFREQLAASEWTKVVNKHYRGNPIVSATQ